MGSSGTMTMTPRRFHEFFLFVFLVLLISISALIMYEYKMKWLWRSISFFLPFLLFLICFDDIPFCFLQKECTG